MGVYYLSVEGAERTNRIIHDSCAIILESKNKSTVFNIWAGSGGAGGFGPPRPDKEEAQAGSNTSNMASQEIKASARLSFKPEAMSE
jgi:hypothetical protein